MCGNGPMCRGMIKAKLSDSKRYESCSPHFAAVFEALGRMSGAEFKAGETLEGGCRFMSQEYFTKPASEKKLEAHRKFIDIQFVAEGEEAAYFGNASDFPVKVPYDDSRDAEFYGGEPREVCVLRAGEFAVFFPEDAHRPGCVCGGKPALVRKIVVKVPV